MFQVVVQLAEVKPLSIKRKIWKFAISTNFELMLYGARLRPSRTKLGYYFIDNSNVVMGVLK
jgi:hypothetical protein